MSKTTLGTSSMMKKTLKKEITSLKYLQGELEISKEYTGRCRTMKKSELKKMLAEATGCTIQHTGWCCGTCFFSVAGKGELTNRDWQTLLHYRGDYKLKDLDNVPKTAEERKEVIDKIYNIAEKQVNKNDDK
jgi:hypothetical protein